MHIQPGEDRLWPKCYECQLWAGHAGDVNDAGIRRATNSAGSAPRPFRKLQPASERPAGGNGTTSKSCATETHDHIHQRRTQNKLTRMNNDRGYIALEGEGKPDLVP